MRLYAASHSDAIQSTLGVPLLPLFPDLLATYGYLVADLSIPEIERHRRVCAALKQPSPHALTGHDQFRNRLNAVTRTGGKNLAK